MGVDIRIAGSSLTKVIGGDPRRIEGVTYSASEESTPIDGGDTTGGTGQINVTIIEDERRDGTELALNNDIEIEDGSNGRFKGTINTVALSAGVATLTGDSLTGKLIADKQVQPFVGTLENAIYYYMGLAGITGTDIFVDPSFASRNVVFPGWFGSLWDFLKQLCWAQQIEISEVSSIIVVRPLRTREVMTETDSQITKNINNGQLAKSIEIYNYNSTYQINGLIYPSGGWNTDVEPYQVNADDTIEINVEVDASIISILQPIAVNSVPKDWTTYSVYSVSGADGLPIPAAQWLDGGGSVTVAINEDRRSLTITIKGARETRYAPYRIAMSSGDGTYYSSLRLTGSAVMWKKELLTLPTGIPAEQTAVDVGITIDSPFVDSIEKAYDVGMRAAGRYAAPVQQLNVTANVINRRGEVGNINLPSFAVFNADYAGQTFANFNTTWSGKTFGDFNDYYFAQVADDFDNQAFGNAAGARVLNGYMYYRVRSATITPQVISYTAERDTTFGDFNTVWAGKTFGDFSTEWVHPSGGYRKFEDFTIQPLRGI